MFSSNEVYELIARHTNDMVCLHDDESTIRFATPSTKEILGWDPERVIGKKLTDYLSEAFINEMDFTTLYRFFNQPGTKIRYQVLHGEGRLRWLETTFIPLEEHAMRYVSTTRDVTESVHLTDDLMAALSKEQELSKFRTNMYAIASHEFKTPLAIIQANIEMLKVKQSPTLLKNGLATMEEEVDRLNSMILDMLELKRLNAGERNMNPSDIDLSELFAELKEDFGEQSKRLIIEYLGIASLIHGDFSLIRYIFSNLLANGLKFSGPEKPVKVTVDYQKDSVEIKVEDEGIGIPEQDQAKIFQSFYRASNAGNLPGTGVGLAIVSEFVNLQKGKINLQSTMGEGSTFIVTLPKRISI